MERFNFAHLPENVAAAFQDTLGCHKNGLMHAYLAMCRLTMQAVFDDLGDGARLRIFDQVDEIIELAEADERVARIVRRTLFDSDGKELQFRSDIDRETTGILLEIMKEILYQTYTRKALLQQKLKMRRFFASQTGSDDPSRNQTETKVSPLQRPTGTGPG